MAKIPVRVIRSVRKTLTIQIEDDASVVVRAPKGLAQERIAAFLKQKAQWIKKGVRDQQSRINKTPVHTFARGDAFLFLGKHLTLEFAAVRSVDMQDQRLVAPRGTKAMTKKRVESWLKNMARDVFDERILYFCKQMKVECNGLRLTSARRRWGSCNHKNGVNVNWRLIMAPPAVIDSVIVHELAHTKYKDHSARFWSFVLKHCPYYKTHKHWLRDNEYLLNWD